MPHSTARQGFAFHPSVPIKPLSPSFLPLRRSLARTPVGVMLRCSLLTFPGLATEAFQIVLFMQTPPQWCVACMEVGSDGPVCV